MAGVYTRRLRVLEVIKGPVSKKKKKKKENIYTKKNTKVDKLNTFITLYNFFLSFLYCQQLTSCNVPSLTFLKQFENTLLKNTSHLNFNINKNY